MRKAGACWALGCMSGTSLDGVDAADSRHVQIDDDAVERVGLDRGQHALGLGEHCRDVEAFARGFARDAGLSEALVADLALAGFLHDAGKADPRFQSLLAYGALGSAHALYAKLPYDTLTAFAPIIALVLAWMFRREAVSVRGSLAIAVVVAGSRI